MKTIALVFLASLTVAFAQVGAPFVTATTLSSSKTDVKSVTKDGLNQIQTIRGIGVGVDWRFFGKPTEPYEIQCFFVAKHDTKITRYVFDSVKAVSQAASGKTAFHAAPLMGSGQKWMDIPFVGTANVTTRTETRDANGNTIDTSSSTSPQTVRGTLRLTDEITGSKTEGWIVRVVMNGRAVKIVSNQNHLEALARDISNTLDAIAEGSRKQ